MKRKLDKTVIFPIEVPDIKKYNDTKQIYLYK